MPAPHISKFPHRALVLKGEQKVDQKFQTELARFLSLVFNEEDRKKSEKKKKRQIAYAYPKNCYELQKDQTGLNHEGNWNYLWSA